MATKDAIIACLNGFGRFGLNLFRWWFTDIAAPYEIRNVSDPSLSASQIARILRTDELVSDFRKYSIRVHRQTISIKGEGRNIEVLVTTGPLESLKWRGDVDMVLECSGVPRFGDDCRGLLIGASKTVLVSANIPGVDATLLYGFNHETYDQDQHRVISFGSCTVHPAVLLTNVVDGAFGVRDCIVNIIHSVPWRYVRSGAFASPERKFCTLETVGPIMLPNIPASGFKVNYTFVPYGGASIMDFAFRLRRGASREQVISLLHEATTTGSLHSLFAIESRDEGPERYVRSSLTGHIVLPSVDVREDTLHLQIYTNNEGSGIQMHKLASYIASRKQ